MNPLLENLDESVNIPRYFEGMGFEVTLLHYDDDEDVEHSDDGDYDFEHVIATWKPELIGETLLGIYDTEDGMIACLVKPLTPFAEALLAFSQLWKMGQVGVARVTAERLRQVEVEEWTPEHDDKHDREELAWAAAVYTLPSYVREVILSENPGLWPWDSEWYKPSSDRIRELEKAGALIAAEIDRLKRETEGGK